MPVVQGIRPGQSGAPWGPAGRGGVSCCSSPGKSGFF